MAKWSPPFRINSIIWIIIIILSIPWWWWLFCRFFPEWCWLGDFFDFKISGGNGGNGKIDRFQERATNLNSSRSNNY